MRTRILGTGMAGDGEVGGGGRRDEQRLLRRQLLLGAGAASLGAACGPADEFDSEEPIDTAELSLPDYTNVPAWSWQTINNFFTFVRDIRWLRMTGSNFNRRLPWLYPDGGCEERAEIICHRAQISFLTKPYKAQVAGFLRFNTNNAPPGRTWVSWGWHIAPIVKNSSSGNVFLIDPSIYTAGPVSMTGWLNRVSGSLNGVTIHPPSYWGPSFDGDIDYAYDQMEDEYLRLEWDRQVALGRNPTQVLGDFPPWL